MVVYMPKPGTGTFYVAKGSVQVVGGDIRQQGDIINEAFEWKHKTPAMLSQGILQFIPNVSPMPPKKLTIPSSASVTSNAPVALTAVQKLAAYKAATGKAK